MSLCSQCDKPVLAKGLCKKHYRAQPERAAVERASHKKWLEQNKDYHNAQQAEYRKNYHEEHREEARMRSAEWRKANPGAHKEIKRQWQRDNPEKHKTGVMNRRARLRKCEGTHTAKEILELFSLQNGKCPICKNELPENYHKDHIVPIAKGGTNYVKNIQLLCPKCNHEKHAKDPIEFMQSKGFLI